MSWLQKLNDTYVQCKGREPDGSKPLMPICHTTQLAQIEIVLDGEGRFRRAAVLDKEHATTLIPCTEQSGGRTGTTPVNHPLCDKLQYVAADFQAFGGEVTSGFARDPAIPHRGYLKSLADWASAQPHPKLDAILSYVKRSSVMSDLVRCGVLPTIPETNQLLKTWSADKKLAPAIFKVLSPTQTPDDAFVRWRVEIDEDPDSTTWADDSLLSSWATYYQDSQTKRGYCMATGMDTTLATQHPAKLRHGGDKAKLISANDGAGFTYRGRFDNDEEALGVGFVATQQAHNALRWLIDRQGYRNGDRQVFVAWEPAGKPIPDLFRTTPESLGGEPDTWSFGDADADAGQAFALRLRTAIAGYSAKLNPRDDVVVIGLDSATPGRMAISYYR